MYIVRQDINKLETKRLSIDYHMIHKLELIEFNAKITVCSLPSNAGSEQRMRLIQTHSR